MTCWKIRTKTLRLLVRSSRRQITIIQCCMNMEGYGLGYLDFTLYRFVKEIVILLLISCHLSERVQKIADRPNKRMIRAWHTAVFSQNSFRCPSNTYLNYTSIVGDIMVPGQLNTLKTWNAIGSSCVGRGRYHSKKQVLETLLPALANSWNAGYFSLCSLLICITPIANESVRIK